MSSHQAGVTFCWSKTRITQLKIKFSKTFRQMHLVWSSFVIITHTQQKLGKYLLSVQHMCILSLNEIKTTDELSARDCREGYHFFGTPCTYDSAKLWYTIQLKISSMVHSAAKI